MNVPPFLRRAGHTTRRLATNPYLLAGLAVLLLVGAGLYYLVDRMVMPTYTRHDVSVVVPDVRDRSFEEAQRLLARYDLQAERDVQRFNADLPRNMVIDQNPAAMTQVKPGRRVYLTVNSGRTQKVTIPSVEGLSLREATYRMQALGLNVADVRPDSIPSPHRNTVTRQQPAPGDSLAPGADVTLWYSTGLGETYVNVPDVVGLSLEEARARLLSTKLRSVVVDAPEMEEGEPLDSTLVVIRQSQDPDTRVREGFEIRLFIGELDELPEDESDERP